MFNRKNWFKILLLGTIAIIALSMQASAEIRGYQKGEGFSYVLLGQYPYQEDGTPRDVLWKITNVTQNHATLMSMLVLEGHQAIEVTDKKIIEKHTFRRIEDYTQSDLYSYMNGEMLDTLLGDSPLRDALVQTPDGLLFPPRDSLLTDPAHGFSKSYWGKQPSRIMKQTPYNKVVNKVYSSSNGGTTYWGSDIKNAKDVKLRIVGYDGHLSWGAYSRVNIGICPFMVLDLSKVQVESGTGAKDDPYVFTHIDGENAPRATKDPAMQ